MAARLLVLVLAMSVASPTQADDRVYASLHPCADDSGGVGSCTANEIDIADATEVILAGEPDSCTAGETLLVEQIEAAYGLNTGVRYDPLLWIGQKGNDPRDPDPNLDPGDETVGSCYVTSAPESDEYPDLFAHLEGDDNDSCLDISNPDLDSVSLPYEALNFEIECQDADSDGTADVHVLVTWVQNTNLLCGNGPDEMFGTGAPPKCNYSLIPLDIEYLEPVTASLTVAKQIDSDDGGTATLDDFDVSVDAEEVAWSNPSSTTGGSELVASEPGTYTLSEADVPGYTEGTWSCIDDDEQDVPVSNGGLFSGADVTVAEDQHVTCSITNSDDAPTLTLLKSVTNDDGGNAEPGDFTLRLDGGIYDNAPFSSGAMPPVVAGTPYTLSEDDFFGYASLGVTCFDETAEGVVPHPVTLAAGQIVTCTLGNDDVAPELTVIKTVVNDDGGDAVPGDWIMVVTATNPSDNNFPGAEAPGTTITIDAGPYSVDETGGPDGYQKILGAGCAGSLDVGESVTCTITGNDIQPSLTISKVILFNDEGPATLGDFDVSVDGSEVAWSNPGSPSGGTEVVATTADTYTLSEAEVEGYQEGTWSCIDADGEVPVSNGGLFSGADVNVMPGQDVTCGIVNAYEDVPPPPQSLTVAKIIVSEHGGSAALEDFNVAVDGVEVAWENPASTSGGIELVTSEAGTYTLSEDDVEGYDEGSWACSDLDGPVDVTDDGAFEGADVTVAPGQQVLCSITNEDQDIPVIDQSLTITKIIISDEGGTATLGDFGVSVNGVEIDWPDPGSTTGGTRLAAIAAGTYTLSENDVEDYTEGTWSCVDEEGEVPVSNGGLFSGADVTVAPGQMVACSIVNEYEETPPPPIEQSLTVTKVIVSEQGGTATLGDFDVSVDGVEVPWRDPGSLTGGSEKVSDLPGTYTLSEADLEGYVEGTWNCSDRYGSVPVSNGGLFSGSKVKVQPGRHLVCSIRNEDERPLPDISVEKTVSPDPGECPVYVGQQLDFTITVSNLGPGIAEGVMLEDEWSWQLKLTHPPDMYECSSPKERTIRCKLGNMDPGSDKDIPIGFSVGGNPGERACNLARVSTYPVDNGDDENNESEVCFDLVGELSLEQDGDLAPATVGVPYEDGIGISGGVQPYEAVVEGLPEGFTSRVEGSEIRIEGCAAVAGTAEITASVSDSASCQDTSAEPSVYRLVAETDPNCMLSGLEPAEIPPAGVVTPDPVVLPDESVQKVAVDTDGGRYFAGFVYADHDYATDPNGPFVQHARNYDIRVVKYDAVGMVLWDHTYDTGNDDYGYAVTLGPHADRPRLYVGGGSEVESGPHAWHDAILLEIDPETGCPVGQHFQSAAQGTTSAFYDIATDGEILYAVGERQRNAALSGEFGALISVFSHGAPREATCTGDYHVIADTPDDELAWQRNIIREGGLIPTVAYAVEVPGPDCAGCGVLVGGRSEAGGWVDVIGAGDDTLAPFIAPGDISVQDLTAPGDRVIVVGSSSGNDMLVLGHDRAGSALWSPINIGKGRLRGVASEASGSFYVVGRSDGEGTAALIFKFNEAGDLLDQDQLSAGFNASFTDVAVFEVGTGVIAGLSEQSASDYGWFQVDFGCDVSCPVADE